MDPNNAIRRRGGGDCVGSGFISGWPILGELWGSKFFRHVYLNSEESGAVMNIFVGDVWMRWGEFIVAGLIFVERCFQNAANEGSGAGMRLGDLDGVGRAEASSDL